MSAHTKKTGASATKKVGRPRKETRVRDEPLERRFAFTINNPTPADEPMPHEWVAYCCYSHEVGAEGTPHYQGYVELYAKCRWSTLINKHILWLKRARKDEIKGSLLENQLYVQKKRDIDEKNGVKPSDNYTEFGTPLPPSPGRIETYSREILAGNTTARVIAEECPWAYHQYGRTFETVQGIFNSRIERPHRTGLFWITGDAGTDKSSAAAYYARKFYESFVYMVKDNGGWSDQYNGQEVVIYDDYRGHIPYDELLKMADIYPYALSQRGKAPYPFTSKLIIITSILSPADCYSKRQERDCLQQLYRRALIVDTNIQTPPQILELFLAYKAKLEQPIIDPVTYYESRLGATLGASAASVANVTSLS